MPFVGMVEMKFPAHFPVDNLADPVVSSLIIPLFKFSAVAYYVIDNFVSVPA